MSGFGENLKREREMRGVTLEEMSESTKISVRLLRALEQDHFAELPGGVFTRSFIRAYAQYLGLEEEHVLSEYKRVAQPSTDYDLSRLTPAPAFIDKGSRGRVLPWVLVAALLGSGYAVYHYNHRSLETPAGFGRSSAASAASPAGGEPAPPVSPPAGTAPGQSPTQPADSTPALSNRSSSAGAEAGNATGNGRPGNETGQSGSAGALDSSQTRPAGANSEAPVLGDGEMVLQVTTSEEAWIAVAADGKTLMQHRLPAKSSRTFRAKDAFDVTTGNAQGTVLTFNGTAQKSLGREGEFKRIHLARSTPQTPAPQGPAH